MKKTILLVVFIIIFYIIIGSTIERKNLIPEDAIRIRVIANSNSTYDQEIKSKIKDDVQKNIYNILVNAKSIEQARTLIKNNLNNIKNVISETLTKENYTSTFLVNYGLNYFPRKEYKGIIYKEGYYESLVITLGSGLGDNWWCVLFPPLCQIEAEESTNVEYTTLVHEIVSKYF